jgi:stage III sporulation protein AA
MKYTKIVEASFEMIDSLLAILPPGLGRIIRSLPETALAELEEIRVRENRPLEIQYGGKFAFVTAGGSLVSEHERGYRPDRTECGTLLDLATRHSLYSYEEELRRGYITVGGGHRIGLAGCAVLEQGCVKLLRDITGFNIRIAREVIGAADPVIPWLLDWDHAHVHHTLIISPPQQGKTTLLRDLARKISSGEWNHPRADWAAKKVGIVDERSELAACVRGVPSFNVGPRTDVLDRCPKAEGMMMLIRSMSPEVIAVDEIGRPEDAQALREALNAGVRVIASAHGKNAHDAARRPMLAELLRENLFSRIVVLERAAGEMPRFRIEDRTGHPVRLRAPSGG